MLFISVLCVLSLFTCFFSLFFHATLWFIWEFLNFHFYLPRMLFYFLFLYAILNSYEGFYITYIPNHSLLVLFYESEWNLEILPPFSPFILPIYNCQTYSLQTFRITWDGHFLLASMVSIEKPTVIPIVGIQFTSCWLQDSSLKPSLTLAHLFLSFKESYDYLGLST